MPDDLTVERRVLRFLVHQRAQLEAEIEARRARLEGIAAALVIVEARIEALEGPDAV